MKDKRTYTNAKEHGEDMSHENEAKIKQDHLILVKTTEVHYMIEIAYKKVQIWAYKISRQRKSEWIRTDNLLKGSQTNY